MSFCTERFLIIRYKIIVVCMYCVCWFQQPVHVGGNQQLDSFCGFRCSMLHKLLPCAHMDFLSCSNLPFIHKIWNMITKAHKLGTFYLSSGSLRVPSWLGCGCLFQMCYMYQFLHLSLFLLERSFGLHKTYTMHCIAL